MHRSFAHRRESKSFVCDWTRVPPSRFSQVSKQTLSAITNAKGRKEKRYGGGGRRSPSLKEGWQVWSGQISVLFLTWGGSWAPLSWSAPTGETAPQINQLFSPQMPTFVPHTCRLKSSGPKCVVPFSPFISNIGYLSSSLKNTLFLFVTGCQLSHQYLIQISYSFLFSH